MTTYNFSFTTGSLYQAESTTLLEKCTEIRDWKKVKEASVTNNLIQANTQRSLRKVTNEVIARLKNLSPEEIQYFQNASLSEQKYILWIAICRHYLFIR